MKFRKNQQKITKCKCPEIFKSTVHKFSSYALTTEEMSELPCGLDHHIPTKADRNTITAEFEQFLSESIKRYLTHS